MSMLCFYVGGNRYAIENRHILRILPWVLLKKIPDFPFYIAGFLNFKGRLIPVVDFCQLIEHRETRSFLHSRIILVEDPRVGSHALIGILGEKVNEMLEGFSAAAHKMELGTPLLPYLDIFSNEGEGVVQCLNVENFFQSLSSEIFKNGKA